MFGMAEKQPKEKAGRLTVNVPEHIRREAKVQAAREDRPLSEVVAELLEKWLAEQKSK